MNEQLLMMADSVNDVFLNIQNTVFVTEIKVFKL
jgi:hypothetical protein